MIGRVGHSVVGIRLNDNENAKSIIEKALDIPRRDEELIDKYSIFVCRPLIGRNKGVKLEIKTKWNI